MITIPILLTSVSDIKEFVNAASRLDCDIDVRCGRYLVDAKSIMGLFSIDLSAPINVEIHGTEAQVDIFRKSVDRFAQDRPDNAAQA